MTYGNGFSRGTSRTLVYDRLKVLKHRAKLRSSRLPEFESALLSNCGDALAVDRRPRDVSPIPVPQSVSKADLEDFLREMSISDNGRQDPAPFPAPVPNPKEASIEELMLCDLLSALPLAEAGKPVTKEDVAPVHALLESVANPFSREKLVALDIYWHCPTGFERRFNALDDRGLMRLYVHAIKFSRTRQARQNGDGGAPPAELCEEFYEHSLSQAMRCASTHRDLDLVVIPDAFVRENESDYARTERWRKSFLEHIVPEKYRELIGKLSIADMLRLCECFREHLEPCIVCEALAEAGEHGKQDGHECHVTECHGDEEDQGQHEEAPGPDQPCAETDEHKKRQRKAKKARQKQNRKEREAAAELAAANHAAPVELNDANSVAAVRSEHQAVSAERPEPVDASTQMDIDANGTIEAAVALLNFVSLSKKLAQEDALDSAVPSENRELQLNSADARTENEELQRGLPDVPVTPELPEVSELSVPGSSESHTLGRSTPSDLSPSEPDLDFAQTKPITPGFSPPATLDENTLRFQRAGTPEPHEFAQTRPSAPSPSRSVAADQTPVRLPGGTDVTGRPVVPHSAESQTSEHGPFQDPNISEQSPSANEVLSRDSSPALSTTSDVECSRLPVPFGKKALSWSEPDRMSILYWWLTVSTPTSSSPSSTAAPTGTSHRGSPEPTDQSSIPSPGGGSPRAAGTAASSEQDAYAGIWFGKLPCTHASNN
ncbi:hypothetical protein CB0940_02247 [Cercospora beticola]|uniref:Uncharacterized protein n=1 Tax=Cercospora beticola TaxID=122368 RepID=A0A2G5I6I6_CERBT|nr:hypothetical protein CB0940_02247 [Cercospora beticola]PIB00438.1 hypothetical protein CB0940_02247 [Cercospora beticola]WPA97591.1 hypothetical protein RHO25_002201 [Cercospora beticola]